MTMLSREDMGALPGVTTETASRAIAELKRRGGGGKERGFAFISTSEDWQYCPMYDCNTRIAATAQINNCQ